MKHTLEPVSPADEFTRRRLLQFALAGAGAVAFAGVSPASAADDQRAADLLAVSQTLCGGGNLSADRATMLLGMIDGNPDLEPGLTELIVRHQMGELNPDGGAFPGSEPARATATAILLFWYASEWGGMATADRGEAYYGVVAWQAMYTSVWAVCKAFGIWESDPAAEEATAAIGRMA